VLLSFFRVLPPFTGRSVCCVNAHSMVMSAIIHRKSHYRHTYTATRNN
jgi:hypothetical protein